MSTIKQKRVAEMLIDIDVRKRYKSLTALLVGAGYSYKTARVHPGALIATQGVQDHLLRLGFTENTAKAAVGEILLSGREENRIKAAQEVFKIFGTYAPEKTENKSLIGIILKEIQNGDSANDITSRNRGSETDKDNQGEAKEPLLEIKQSILDKK